MTSNVKLLPLPKPKNFLTGIYSADEVRTCVEANTEALRAEVEALKHHCTLLSNIAYKLAQDDRLYDSVRWSLDDSRKKWDTAIHPAAAQEGK